MKALCPALAILAIAPAVACAQWSDNFDSYANGTVLNHVGGWFGWDDQITACGTVTDAVSRSAPHSVVTQNGTDVCQGFTGITSGAWSLTTHLYIPTGWTGQGYYILMNDYNHFGPYNWTLQLQWDSATGLITELDTAVRPNNTPRPFMYDQWVELRVDFDLDNDTLVAYYGGQEVTNGPWKRVAATSFLEFEAIDLWSNFTSANYYDDFVLEPMGGGCEPDITTTAIPGSAGYLVPNGILNNDDFFAFLIEFSAGNLAVADVTTTAIPGSAGYGVPNGVINNDDFFYYLSIFAAGC